MSDTAALVRPEFVCRVAGIPAGSLASLRAGETAAVAGRLLDLEAALEAARGPLTEQLHAVIGRSPDQAARRVLVQLKRDVHNLRPSAPDRGAAAEAHLPHATRELLAEFQERLAARDALREVLRDVHARETSAVRARFAALLDHPGFLNGIAISSRALLRALPAYRTAAMALRPLRGREAKTERGLLRYFTRAAMKATPFATFGSVVAGHRASTAAEDAGAVRNALVLKGDAGARRSSVRLNKNLLGILLYHLKTREEVRRVLPVERNPTVREDGGRLVFLAAPEGRERFLRIAPNAVIRLIGERLEERPAPPLGELTAALVADPRLDAAPAEVAAYLDRLLEVGFLRFRTGIPEHEAEWDLPLRTLLEGIGDPHARRCAELLATLRRLTDRYAGAAADVRCALLDQMRAALSETLSALGIGAAAAPDALVYEDTTADAEVSLPATPAVERALAELGEFTTRMHLAGWPRAEQAAMRHFFDLRYAGEGEEVAVLRFYEDYYREHLKARLERERERVDAGLEGHDPGNPFGLAFVNRLSGGTGAVSEVVRRLWSENPDAREIQVSAGDLDAALAGIPAPAHPCVSSSVFAQWIGGDEPAVLIPSGFVLGGYGQYFSRFLHLLPEAFVRAVRDGNEALTSADLAEICGDGFFNANLHPPLLRSEISCPTGESGGADEQILVADLVVEPDPRDAHALRLVHRRTRRQVLPVDLGFQSHKQRPPLYRLLAELGPVSNARLFLPASPRPQRNAARPADGGPPTAPPAVVRRPRIRYGRHLVLSREQWLVPDSLFPASLPDEAPADHLLRVERWRRAHGIPAEVFVRVRPLRRRRGGAAAGGSGEEAARPATRQSRELDKPQYVDFRNPLLVSLFGRLTAGVEDCVAILEERFPGEDDLVRCGGERYATELVFQVDVRRDAPGRDAEAPEASATFAAGSPSADRPELAHA